ncbi:hypothetical protein D3C80_1199630 [compost metagenome]
MQDNHLARPDQNLVQKIVNLFNQGMNRSVQSRVVISRSGLWTASVYANEGGKLPGKLRQRVIQGDRRKFRNMAYMVKRWLVFIENLQQQIIDNLSAGAGFTIAIGETCSQHISTNFY